MFAVLLLGSLQTAQALEDDFEVSEKAITGCGPIPLRICTRTILASRATCRTIVLRIQPEINFEIAPKSMFMTDVLDDVVWGDNQSISSTALFAEIPSNTNEAGTGIDLFALKRAWMEIDLAVGPSCVLAVSLPTGEWGSRPTAVMVTTPSVKSCGGSLLSIEVIVCN